MLSLNSGFVIFQKHINLEGIGFNGPHNRTHFLCISIGLLLSSSTELQWKAFLCVLYDRVELYSSQEGNVSANSSKTQQDSWKMKLKWRVKSPGMAMGKDWWLGGVGEGGGGGGISLPHDWRGRRTCTVIQLNLIILYSNCNIVAFKS